MCTLLWWYRCTVLDAAPNCSQISIHGSIRHCSTRSILRAGTSRCVFCTNSRFMFLVCPFSQLPFHMHPALVQPLYRAKSNSKMYTNFHSLTYPAFQYAELFAGPSRSVGFLHQQKVNIFRLSFPIAYFSYAPWFGATIVPFYK